MPLWNQEDMMKTYLTLLLWGWQCLLCRYHSERFRSPDVQGWAGGEAGLLPALPAHQPVLLCLEVLAGIRAPLICKAAARWDPCPKGPLGQTVQEKGNIVYSSWREHFWHWGFPDVRKNVVAQQGGAARSLHAHFWLVGHPGFICWAGLSEMVASLHVT